MTASYYTVNVFSLDEKFRTERFFASLPVRRKDIVLARYAGVMAIAGAYFVVAYLVNAVSILLVPLYGGAQIYLKVFGKTEVQTIPLGYCATVLVLVAIIPALTFPLYFKLGLAKAKTITTLLLAIFMALITLIILLPSGGSHRVMKVIPAVMTAPFPRDLLFILLLIAAAILLWGVSIPVAVALYSRKDL
jgi:hypothetical protein